MASSFRCLITAGPTREYIDPVRFISNPSSGKMGYALAQAAVARGWSVDLVSGPVALPEPDGVVFYPVETGEEMYAQVDALFPACDCLLMVAAVCDFRPARQLEYKEKKDTAQLQLELEPVVDILQAVTADKDEHQTVVGFAAETSNIEAYALDKLHRKKMDWIVANRVGGNDSAFGSDSNTVQVFGSSGQRFVLGPLDKNVLARELLTNIFGKSSQSAL